MSKTEQTESVNYLTAPESEKLFNELKAVLDKLGDCVPYAVIVQTENTPEANKSLVMVRLDKDMPFGSQDSLLKTVAVAVRKKKVSAMLGALVGDDPENFVRICNDFYDFLNEPESMPTNEQRALKQHLDNILKAIMEKAE